MEIIEYYWKYWQLLVIFGNYWKQLEIVENYWKPLNIIENYCVLMEIIIDNHRKGAEGTEKQKFGAEDAGN